MMIGRSIPIVRAVSVGSAATYISGSSTASRLRPTSASRRWSRANWRSSTRTAEPSSVSRQARSRYTPDMVLSSASKPLSLRSATRAPRSAGCSQARELSSVNGTRERAGFFSPEVAMAAS